MPTPTIFISYRRTDTVGQAGRLFDRLAERFGRAHVYRDLDTIAAGEDFVEAVREKINRSDVLLVLIGPRWLTEADEAGRWRLADENDLVRVEITLALERNVRVIPVLVQGASMPKAKDLPGALVRLAQRHAVEIRDMGFEQDVAQLFAILEPTWRHKLVRVFARRPVYAGLTALAATLFGFWIYSQIALNPERARIQVVQMGLAYDADTFVKRAADNDAQAVNLFLRAGMAPDAENRKAETALMWAAAKGNLALVKTLIEKGADGDRAMAWAAGGGQRETLGFLLARARSKNAINTALNNAARSTHTDIVLTLLDQGADVDFKGRQGNTALAMAAGDLRLETVRLLLSRGANANANADDGQTALHEAIGANNSASSEQLERNRMEIVEALLSKGAEITARWRYMETRDPTPLLLAIENKHSQIALRLIEHGSDVNAQTGDGNRSLTALMWAAKEGLTEVVRALLAKGAEVDARNERGETALLVRTDSGQHQTAVAQALIAGGADANARNTSGETGLMLAARSRYQVEDGFVEALLASGADINAVDKDGWTALMFAARSGQTDIARILLSRGADTRATNHDGQNALTIASKSGDKEIVKALGGARPMGSASSK